EQQLHDGSPERGRNEPAVFLADILAVLDLAQDLGVGRRTADSVLFEKLHERGLVESRGRLCLLALRMERDELQSLPLRERRKFLPVFLLLGFGISRRRRRLHAIGRERPPELARLAPHPPPT